MSQPIYRPQYVRIGATVRERAILGGSIQLLRPRRRCGRGELKIGPELTGSPPRDAIPGADSGMGAGGNWRRRCRWEKEGQAAVMVPSGVWRWCRTAVARGGGALVCEAFETETGTRGRCTPTPRGRDAGTWDFWSLVEP